MKRLVDAGVIGDGEEFEGFRGGGGLALLKRLSGGTTATSSSGFHSRFQSQQSGEGFEHFSFAPPQAEQDDEEVDLDGGLNARTNSKSGGTHSNGGASNSRRNRTPSTSASDRVQHISQSHQMRTSLSKSKMPIVHANQTE